VTSLATPAVPRVCPLIDRRHAVTASLLVIAVSAFAGCSGAATRPGSQTSAPAALPGAAKPAAASATPYECKFTEDAIAIDGTLDDAAWKDATTIENFSMPWLGKDNKPATKATRAKILWDRENLYISADLDDADLYADVTEHDGQIWDNDVFEVFLKPSTEKPS
jgi:hypothetical protein